MFEAVFDLIGVVATVAVAMVVPASMAAMVKLLKKWGIEIEAVHREALQSALHHAAMVAVSKIGKEGGKVTLKTVPINVALDYIKNSVPDAVGEFGLDDSKLRKLLEPHIANAMKQNLQEN